MLEYYLTVISPKTICFAGRRQHAQAAAQVMGLNDMVLSSALLTGLYKEVLIEEKTGRPPEMAPVTPFQKPLSFLGKNQRHVCILVDYATDVHLPEQQLSFLTAMLQACRLNLADVAIVNVHQQPCSFTRLKEEFRCTSLLLFSDRPLAGGLEAMPEFTPIVKEDVITVQSPTLEKLDNSAEGKLLKSKLWLCLKQIFAV